VAHARLNNLELSRGQSLTLLAQGNVAVHVSGYS
jgi:hypothetical protein